VGRVGDGGEGYVVDEAEIDDVDGDLGVIAAAERAENVLFGDRHLCLVYLNSGFIHDVLKSLTQRAPFDEAQGRLRVTG
jgi:hypothetical protein